MNISLSSCSLYLSGKVRTQAAVQEIVTNSDGTVKHLLLRTGEIIVADEYISAMPVDIMKRMLPKAWSTMPYFRQMDELEGIPVINLHMWFDKKLIGVDHLCFSRSPLLSVYADMSVTCKEYYDPEKSMLELVFAPCSPLAGGDVNWIGKSDDEIIQATMEELARLFPTEVCHLTVSRAEQSALDCVDANTILRVPYLLLLCHDIRLLLMDLKLSCVNLPLCELLGQCTLPSRAVTNIDHLNCRRSTASH